MSDFYPELDPNNPLDKDLLKRSLPSKEARIEFVREGKQSLTEQKEELWAMFEAEPAEMEALTDNFAPGGWDLDDEYHQHQMLFRDRGVQGVENNPRQRETFVALEWIVEEVLGKRRIETKQMDMYKGTVKNWQVLDDAAYDREEIAKIQAAIKAPLPDELDMYKEKHSKPMQLPITNENVYKWRDDARAIDSADFDPKLIQMDREKKKSFFLDRYEKPKELAE
mmetsp:Transcript_27287/g.20423  ORF Transcript_27287/g.20423 Transcript_27287/m.20423 type:complete len:224 (+) Transcript_27287:272-943(+)